MREKTIDDSPAFGHASQEFSYKGLTKREYFAGLAMQGLLAGNYKDLAGNISEYAVMYADSLIKELNQLLTS